MKKVGFLVVVLAVLAIVVFLPFVHAHYAEVLVYEYTTNETTVYIGDLHPSDFLFASARGNVFSLAEDATIRKVEVEMQRVGSPTADLFAVIYLASGGKPTGSALATSDAINTATISTSWGTKYNFIFSTPYEVTASTTYCYVIQAGTTGVLDAGSDHYVNFHGANGNSAGTSYGFSSWSANSNPLVMNVYSIVEIPSPPPAQTNLINTTGNVYLALELVGVATLVVIAAAIVMVLRSGGANSYVLVLLIILALSVFIAIVAMLPVVHSIEGFLDFAS